MKRKLTLVNLALLAVLVAGALELHRRVGQANDRYEILHRFDAPKDAPPFPSPQAPERVRQADYLPVVDRMLFHPDRNAIVEVEAPVQEAVVRPALPVLSGVMDLGDGPIALMADSDRGSPRPVGVGEKVGEYTFLGFSGDKLKLSWQGEEIEVAQDRLEDAVGSGSRGGSAAGGARRSSSRRPARRAAQKSETKTQQAQADNRETIGGRYNIGTEIRPGVFRADPRDASPAGTEFQGFRKVVNQTPFGSQSWWVRTDAQSQPK